MSDSDIALTEFGADSSAISDHSVQLDYPEQRKIRKWYRSPYTVALILLTIAGIAVIFMILYYGTDLFDKTEKGQSSQSLQGAEINDITDLINEDKPATWRPPVLFTTTTRLTSSRLTSTSTTRRRILPSRTTAIARSTSTTIPRRINTNPCTTAEAFYAAFKHKCSLVLVGTLPEAQEDRCSLLLEVLLCTKKSLLPLECSLETVREQLQRLHPPNNQTSNELYRAQLLNFQCPEDLEPVTRQTGIVARPTTAPLCTMTDNQIIAAFYEPECMAIMYRQANSTAAKCRNLYALASCMAMAYQSEFPECSYHAAYHLLTYPTNEFYFTRNFQFKPAKCPVPEEELPPLPGPTCELKRSDIKNIFRKNCMKSLEEGAEHAASFCRRYETTMRCIGQHIRDRNQTCDEQFIRQTAAEKDITYSILVATGFTIMDCDGPKSPECEATGEDIIRVYKEKCFLILYNLQRSSNASTATSDGKPSDEQCSAMKRVYECVSFTLLRTGKSCSVSIVKWNLEASRHSSIFQGSFGFEPLQCNIDFVPAPTVSPTCTATDDDIITALYNGCFDKLYRHDGTVRVKCQQYKEFVTCTVSRLVERNHTHCGLDPVRYLLEHPNNHEYFLSEFGYLPSKNCTFLWPTAPTPTDEFLGNKDEDNWDLPDHSVRPCASAEMTLAYVLDGCSADLIEQEAYQDQRRARLCWAWFRLADCVSEGFKESNMVCTMPMVHASLLQGGILSMFTISFNFDPRICFSLTQSTVPSVIGQG